MNRWKPLGVLIAAIVIGCSMDGEPGSHSIEISTAEGQATRFEPSDTTVGLASAVMVRFRNASSQAHNLVFVGELDAATRTIVEPGQTDEVNVVIPGPGTYTFVCTIHESMQGSLTVSATTASR